METPLTPRMHQCLAALLRLEHQRRFPSTPNEIAHEVGFQEGGRRHGNGAAIRSWSGHMPPSNRVNFALIALEKRGLIQWTDRRDDLSGRAVALTAAGAKVAHALPADDSRAKNAASSRAQFRFGE